MDRPGGSERRLFIVNPASRGGAAATTWDEIRVRIPLRPDTDQVCFTRRPGEAEELAASAIDFATIVAVGGDGTVSEVLSGIMQRPVGRPQLAIIPHGTGNDIARQIGIGSVEASLSVLDGGEVRQHDLLQIDQPSPSGIQTRYGILLGAAGFSASAMVRPWMKKWLPPGVAYYLSTLLAILWYRPPIMTIRAGATEHSGSTWIVVAANAERVGGDSMRIAPGASTEDGRMRVTIVPAASKWDVCTRLLPKVSTGAHLEEPDVIYFETETLEVVSAPPAVVEVDGEIVGVTPVAITLRPGAIDILSGPSPR